MFPLNLLDSVSYSYGWRIICYSRKQLCCVCLMSQEYHHLRYIIIYLQYWVFEKGNKKCLSICQICNVQMTFVNISKYIYINMTISKWILTFCKCTFQNLNECWSNCVYCLFFYVTVGKKIWHDITSNEKYDGVFCGKHCKKSWVVEMLIRCEQEWLWCANTHSAETWIS